MKNSFQSILLIAVFGVFGVVDADEEKSVIEGDSLTLHNNITELQADVQIEWRFTESVSSPLIVQIKQKKYTLRNYTDGRFTSRLQVNNQTGDLTIKNMRIKHSGRYQAEIINKDRTSSIKKFNVTVIKPPSVLAVGLCEVKSVSVMEDKSVTLHTDVETHRGDLILWRFGDEGALIAKYDKEVNKSSIDDDGIFRGRLKLDDHTGDLTIPNTKTTDTGVYKLKIGSNSKNTQKTFSVAVRAKDKSWSLGTIVVAAVPVVAVAVVAVLWCLRRNSLRTIVVCEGDDVTLPSGQSNAMMKWIFNNHVIARYDTKNDDVSTYGGPEEKFKNRLDLNKQTRILTIKNIKTRHSGLYELTFKRFYSRILGLWNIQCNVIVKARIISEQLERRVTLDFGKENVKEKEEIVWMFGAKDIRIAQLREGKVLFYNYTDERFHDNLEINEQTGSLTIKNLTTKNTGAYQVQILKSEETEYKKFYVTVLVFAELGGTVTLRPNEDINKGDRVKWIFYDKIDLVCKSTTEKNEEVIKYTEDKIFKGRLEMNMKTGDLKISNIGQTDGGIYKLQCISSDKIACRKFTVEVLAPGQVNSERIRPAKLGHSVTLDTGVIKLQRDDEVQWRLGDEEPLIAKITEPSNKSPVVKFSDKLEMNSLTGILTIRDITPKLSGDYKATISSSRNRRTQYRTYKVAIYVNTDSGESVTLHTESEIQEGCEIKWIYGDNTCLVAGKNGDREIKYTEDERFKKRLTMDPKTGDLTITDSRWEDSGLYTLVQKTTDGNIPYRIFRVWVSGTKKNDSTSVEMRLLDEADDRS